MLEKAIQIYNTLFQVEVKGQSTKALATCMILMEELIKDMQSQQSEKNN